MIEKIDMQRQQRNEKVDAAWYKKTYPDVAGCNLTAEYHFKNYGKLMGRFPNQSSMDTQAEKSVNLLSPPQKNKELLSAYEISRSGDYRMAIEYAQRYVPQSLCHTIEALRANQALARGDQKGWIGHLNTYLAHYGTTPLRLKEGTMLLDRFTCDALPAITGGALISVIMPAWNSQKTIRAAAQSILNQTWKNLELLIVDDASEDATWGIMQEIAASDSRVRIWRNPINTGPYVAKNIAFSMSRGEWITGHDADDWAHPQRLEQHMAEIHACPTPPRASMTSMVRVEGDGTMDRFAPICEYSMDGVSRIAPISCQFRADFLRDTLGGWDNIRFSADSELIARTEKIIGDECKKFPQISMLCLNHSASLTNHPKDGVGRLTGPSESRRLYYESYTKWHKTLQLNTLQEAKLSFPPPPKNERPFDAPDAAVVPNFKVRRAYATLTGRDKFCQDDVTVICPSKRPWFLSRVADMMKAQTHKNLHVIYVAHGPGHKISEIKNAFSGVKSLKVIEVSDPNVALGTALNKALEQCSTDLVAKIDDDDFYGPNYIRSAIAALRYNGHKNVGIVGKERAYCYVEDMDLLALRFGGQYENNIRERVYGGTIFWSRKILLDQRFIASSAGEDSAFFRMALEKGVKIFSDSASDYVYMRYATQGAHTWNIDSRDFLKSAVPLAKGIRLDLAYSTQLALTHTPVPKPPNMAMRAARSTEKNV